MRMREDNFSHKPVMLDECIDALAIRPDGIYIDGTAGGGGHSRGIAQRLTTGRLIAIDQDGDAIAAAGKNLSEFGERVRLVRDNFCNIAAICAALDIAGIDGLLLDLGVSSYQLDTPERGFSYSQPAPLDMRMDARNPLDAATVLNEYPESELKRILYEYGEERFAPRIAAAIARARKIKKIENTSELSEIIMSVIPAALRERGHHPAKRSFQAIRIEVNRELDVIAPAITEATALLKPGGRIAVITFHSLEDRIVKKTFASLASGCNCPRDFPICICGREPEIKLITNKPILPSAKEQEINPRSRSAKLRAAQKL